jgi:hypothetical protein
MLVRSEASKIERGDLLCAFHGWWRQEMGDDVRLLGGRWLFPKFRVACPWAVEIMIKGVRFFGGIALVAEGLKLWSYQNDGASRGGRGAKGTASSADRAGSVRRRSMDREVEGIVHLIHVVEHERLAMRQAQSTRVVQDRVPGYELQHFALMTLANFSQSTVTREHLTSAQRLRSVLKGSAFEQSESGEHGLSPSFAGAVPTCADFNPAI